MVDVINSAQAMSSLAEPAALIGYRHIMMSQKRQRGTRVHISTTSDSLLCLVSPFQELSLLLAQLVWSYLALRPEGGVEGSKKSLLRFGPARRAGPDAIIRIVLAHTVKEKFEVNLCSKNVDNLQ